MSHSSPRAVLPLDRKPSGTARCWLAGITAVWIVVWPAVSEANVADVKTCLVEHARGFMAGAAEVSATVPDAEDLLREIGSYLGMDRNVSILPCALVEKVEAWAVDPDNITGDLKDAGVPSGRYVVYNPTWVREVIGDDRDQAVFLFGHEYGHFLSGHFFERRNVDRVTQELEADQFGGCATARLQSKWSSVANLVSRVRPKTTDGYYPAAARSLSIVEEGFRDCGGDPVQKCRLQEYGVESWGYEVQVEKKSNWRGGGGNQPGFCAEAAAELKLQYPDPYEFEVVSSRERTRDTCQPFRCIEYQYFCTIKIKGDPIYEERTC